MTTQEFEKMIKEKNQKRTHVKYTSLAGDEISVSVEDSNIVQDDLHEKMEKRNCNDLYVKIQDDAHYFEHNDEIYNKIIELQNLLIKNS